MSASASTVGSAVNEAEVLGRAGTPDGSDRTQTCPRQSATDCPVGLTGQRLKDR